MEILASRVVVPNQSLRVMSRVVTPSQLVVRPTEVAECKYTAYDHLYGTVLPEYTDVSVDPATVFFDPIVSDDPNWTADDIGYNFRYDFPPELFTTAHPKIRIMFTATLTTGYIVSWGYLVHVTTANLS